MTEYCFDPDCGSQDFPHQFFHLRFHRLRLSQAAFAERFGLSVGMVRDVEQGRCEPSRAFRVLVELIAEHPASVATAAKRATTGSPDFRDQVRARAREGF